LEYNNIKDRLAKVTNFDDSVALINMKDKEINKEK
jgi:hypothetical protein